MKRRLGQFVYVPPPALVAQGAVPPSATPNWQASASPGIYEQNGQAVYVSPAPQPGMYDQFANILSNYNNSIASIADSAAPHFLFYAGIGIILISLLIDD